MAVEDVGDTESEERIGMGYIFATPAFMLSAICLAKAEYGQSVSLSEVLMVTNSRSSRHFALKRQDDHNFRAS